MLRLPAAVKGRSASPGRDDLDAGVRALGAYTTNRRTAKDAFVGSWMGHSMGPIRARRVPPRLSRLRRRTSAGCHNSGIRSPLRVYVFVRRPAPSGAGRPLVNLDARMRAQHDPGSRKAGSPPADGNRPSPDGSRARGVAPAARGDRRAAHPGPRTPGRHPRGADRLAEDAAAEGVRPPGPGDEALQVQGPADGG